MESENDVGDNTEQTFMKRVSIYADPGSSVANERSILRLYKRNRRMAVSVLCVNILSAICYRSYRYNEKDMCIKNLFHFGKDIQALVG